MKKIFQGDAESLAVSPKDFNKIFVVGQTKLGSAYVPAVHKSTDGGNNWTTHKLTSKVGVAQAVVVNPKNDNVLYAGGYCADSVSRYKVYAQYKGALFRSTNGGNSWTKVGGNISEYINAIDIDPGTPSIVYVGTSSGVYKSTNSGDSWKKTPMSSSLKCIKVYPNNPKIVFAAGYSGIQYSTDKGQTWAEANKGLSVWDVECLDFNLKKKIMYAGTNGGSVYWNKKILKKIK
jgi:photosystem II stability/assembly factor-like uncharacterized protein